MPDPDPRHPRAQALFERWAPLAAGLLALAPLIAYRGLFRRLFWFGDEFDLIDQMDRLGFWRWTWLVFAENFVPLFKVLWGGAVLLFHGSYFSMIVLVWLVHAANVALLGRVMRACAAPWLAVGVAQVLFGLAPSHFETLGWSVQGSAVLSVAFMLLAMDGFFRSASARAPFAWSAASALAFSRGVLTGALLCGACLWPGTGEGPGRRVRAALYLVPVLVVGALIAVFAQGNQRHMAGHVLDAAVYGAWYYSLNPAYRILRLVSWGWGTVAALGLGKLVLVAWALARSRGSLRLLFVLLAAFDLGNAGLLGLGRYHTGLETVISSRYQYASLLGIAPLAGYWIARQWGRIPGPGALRSGAAAAALAGASLLFCLQWPRELEPFTRSRGTESRRLLLGASAAGPHGVPGIPFMEMGRARALIAAYTLH